MRPIPRTTMTGLAGLIVLATLGAACSAGKPAESGPRLPTASPHASPSRSGAPPTPATSPSTDPQASPDALLAVGRKGVEALEVILASTRELMLDLPAGVPMDERWSHVLTTRRAAETTVVRDLVVQPGLGGDSTTLDGAWRLPTVGPDPVPVGVSADGWTIVLVEAKPETDGRTRFAVLRRGFATKARIIELDGRFDFDALSPDGAILYLVEHLDAAAGGVYQVRALDTASGRLRDGAIADKRNLDEQMAGYPLAQVRRPDGIVLTLYRGREHPFVHLLNTVEGWAVCLDLPATRAHDDAAAADWGLAPSPDGRFVYAVDATLGLVEQIDPAQSAVVRSATVEPLAGSGIVLTKFGHEEGGPVGRRAVVAPDGRTVYAAGTGGILAIDATTLTVTGRFLTGMTVETLAVTPDGGSLYALLADGHIVKLDAAMGALLATVPGDGYDRLVAVMPW